MADPVFRLKKFVAQGLFEKASAVVPAKDILPVLKNFQVEVKSDSLSVVATDMELSVVCHTELVAVEDPGTVVLPAKKMLEIIRESADGDIEISVSEGAATISAGGARWLLRLPTGEDYPAIPDTSQVTWTEVPRERFLAAIQAVRGAAARDMNRPSLMMIDVSNEKMTACDGVRFQQTTLTGFPLSLQIPVGAVDDLVKLLKATEVEKIEVGETEFHLVFKVGTDEFVAAKLMATFPDVEELLLRPALMNHDQFDVVTKDLVDAVRRVRINADEDSSAIVLELSKDSCVVVSRDKFGNRAEETISGVWEYADRKVAVNHQYLLDMLAMHTGTSCTFYLGTDTKSRKSPLMLRDKETIGIVNQMRLDWV